MALNTNHLTLHPQLAHLVGTMAQAETSTTRLVGRCKTCKKGRGFEGVLNVRARDINGEGGGKHYDNVQADGYGTEITITMHCECGKRVKLHPVEWKRTATPHKCSAKCQSATGFQCECECRGRFHGGRY